MMIKSSINIILEQYKRGNITEEEAVTLIEDLYRDKQSTITPYWPQITYYTETFPDYKVTCNVNK